MKRRLLLFLCCLLIPVARSTSEPVPKDMQLFLLVGQSNMAGRGQVEAQDQLIHPRIFMLAKDLQWLPAKDPLHFDKPSMAGVGLGSEFARTLVKADLSANIDLIPSAVGGTSLDQWQPGEKLYAEAVQRAQEAMKNGHLAGILWHQGEADSKAEKVATYAARFSKMIGQLRNDLHAPEAPVVVGELGRFYSPSTAFNAVLPEVVRQIPRCTYVTSEDLTDRGDQLHFDSASQRTLGQRYAAAYQKLIVQPCSPAAR